jgi:hypothetical protein
MKTNVLLFVLVLFIISLIITLNVFFQQTYQSEMAEQFNSQQLLIAKSIASRMERALQHAETETVMLGQYVAAKDLGPQAIEDFIAHAHYDIRVEMNADIKIIGLDGRLFYGSSAEPVKKRDTDMLSEASEEADGRVIMLTISESARWSWQPR